MIRTFKIPFWMEKKKRLKNAPVYFQSFTVIIIAFTLITMLIKPYAGEPYDN